MATFSYKGKKLLWTKYFRMAQKFKETTENYNIILRPHPKTLKTFNKLEDIIKKQKLIVDFEADRKLENLLIFQN